MPRQPNAATLHEKMRVAITSLIHWHHVGGNKLAGPCDSPARQSTQRHLVFRIELNKMQEHGADPIQVARRCCAEPSLEVGGHFVAVWAALCASTHKTGKNISLVDRKERTLEEHALYEEGSSACS